MNKATRGVTLGIFDPAFRYRSSRETDIRKTFERIRRQRAAAARQAENALPGNVATLPVNSASR